MFYGKRKRFLIFHRYLLLLEKTEEHRLCLSGELHCCYPQVRLGILNKMINRTYFEDITSSSKFAYSLKVTSALETAHSFLFIMTVSLSPSLSLHFTCVNSVFIKEFYPYILYFRPNNRNYMHPKLFFFFFTIKLFSVFVEKLNKMLCMHCNIVHF